MSASQFDAQQVRAQNLFDESLGGCGFKAITDSTATAPDTGMCFRAIQCIGDVTFSTLTNLESGDGTAVTWPAGFWVFGRFRIAKSALSGKTIITVIPESAPFPIYDRAEFVSDTWDPLTYGKDYDASRSFIEQLVELQSKVPHPHQTGVKNVNCDWADDVWDSKDGYLSRSLSKVDTVSYGYRLINCKNCVDILSHNTFGRCQIKLNKDSKRQLNTQKNLRPDKSFKGIFN